MKHASAEIVNRRNRFSPRWSPYAWHTICGLLDLCNLLRTNYKPISNLSMIEIGSHLGESTCIFAGSGLFKTVWSVDIFNNSGYYEIYEKNRKRNYPDIIHPIKNTSANAAKEWNNGLVDMIYIDADHNYKSIREDIDLWAPKIKKGGIISGHD